MEKIPLPDGVTVIQEAGHEATFEIAPYFPGYGPTVGNALRRVLLSSLSGAAITSLRCEGIEHEFSTLPGVAEDIVTIILNLKRVRLKLHGERPVELRLNAAGVRTVTAGDMEKVADVEVVNPTHVLAHLTDEKAALSLILTAERGRGYVPVEAREQEERPLGTMGVDAIFTPVERVSFRVENVRVGQVTEYHKLLLTIRTDGTIAPREALSQAASILEDHFKTLTQDLEGRLTYRREAPTASPETASGAGAVVPLGVAPAVAAEGSKGLLPDVLLPGVTAARLVQETVPEAVRAPEERPRDPKLTNIVDLAVSTRIQNILEKEGMKTVAGLLLRTRSQLLGLPGLGEKALEEIDVALRQLGVSLREEPSA